jgi:serine/threonine protein phosphatase PrpC
MSVVKLLRTSALPLGAALSWQLQQRYSHTQPSLTIQPEFCAKSLCTFPANNPTEDRSIYYENKDINTRIFGVFDGHGGWNVSNYLQNNLTDVLLENLNKNTKVSRNMCPGDVIESSILHTFTELEEAYIDKIRSAYELGFGGTICIFSHCCILV